MALRRVGLDRVLGNEVGLGSEPSVSIGMGVGVGMGMGLGIAMGPCMHVGVAVVSHVYVYTDLVCPCASHQSTSGVKMTVILGVCLYDEIDFQQSF